MKNIAKVFFAIALLFAVSASADKQEKQAPKGISLEECIAKAIQASENIAVRESDLRFAKAQYEEAFGDIYPKIHLLADQRFQDERGNRFNSSGSNNNNGNDFINSNTSKKNRRESYLNIRQPIFSGFKDFALVASAKAELKARTLDAARNKQLLAQSVAEAFYQVLLYRSDLAELDSAGKAISDRVTELHKFAELGKAKESEILAAQSEIIDLEASKEATKGALVASEELLSFFAAEDLRGAKLNIGKVAPVHLSLDEYISQATNRADVEAHAQRAISAEHNLEAAKGSKYPTISAEASYFLTEDPSQPREWEAFLRFDLPIFEGFKIDSRIEQQRELLSQARLQSSEVHRLAEKETRMAFAETVSAKLEASKLAELVTANKRNYASQKKDYELGIVSNLDVLQALKRLHDSERRFKGAELKYKLSQFKLDIAAGGYNL